MTTVVNPYTVLEKIYDIIRLHPDLQDAQVNLQEYVNQNPTYASKGWISVYDNEVDYDPNTLGGDNADGEPVQWMFTGDYYVLIQYASFQSGADCAEHLHELENIVITEIFRNKDLRTVIDQVTKVETSYSSVPTFADEDSGTEDFNFQQVLIEITVEVDRR